MPLEVDDGTKTPSKVQIFISGEYLVDDVTDAKDNIDKAFDSLAEDLSWTVGVKRLFYREPHGDGSDHIRDIKNSVYSILDMTGSLLMTNHMARREMYLYYTASKKHDLEYADAGYMCFEVPIDSMKEVAMLLGVASVLSRKSDPSRAVISAAEATKSYHRGTMKIKLMPRDAVEDNWGEITDILGEDIVHFFEIHHKS